MKSVRFDDRLQARLSAAARAAGVTESEFIRQAVAERSEQLLGDSIEHRLSGVLGAISSRGGRARKASSHYLDLLRQQRRKGSKRRS